MPAPAWAAAAENADRPRRIWRRCWPVAARPGHGRPRRAAAVRQRRLHARRAARGRCAADLSDRSGGAGRQRPAVRRHPPLRPWPGRSGDIAIRLAGQPDDPVSLSLAGVRGLGEAAVLLGLTDTSEETRLKRQVAQATKMQAVGQLAGGVAHDFNNVLTAILGTCDLMLLRHTPGDSDYDDIQQIRANSNRAASLTRQLLAFSRQQTLRPEVLQLPDVVTEVSQMLKRLIGEKIQLSVRHDRDLGPVRADPTQLEQVIVNLAVNARDAMQAHGIDAAMARAAHARHPPHRPRRTCAPCATRSCRRANIPRWWSKIPAAASRPNTSARSGSRSSPPRNRAGRPGRHRSRSLDRLWHRQAIGRLHLRRQRAGQRARGSRSICRSTMPDKANDGRRVARPAGKPKAQWAGGGRVLLVEDEDPVRMVAERRACPCGL